MMRKTTILLTEMNRVLQEGVTAMLLSNREFDAFAQFEEDDAVRQLKSLNLQPDVVLLDLGIENTSNLTLRAQLKEEIPAARILTTDVLPRRMNIIEFVRAGGHALILKNTPAADWRSTLIAVAHGENVASPILTRPRFSRLVSDALAKSSDLPSEADRLTTREREIVNLIADGLSNKEIAGLLHIASYAVKSHVHLILEKLTLNTRLQIAAYIRRKNS